MKVINPGYLYNTYLYINIYYVYIFTFSLPLHLSLSLFQFCMVKSWILFSFYKYSCILYPSNLCPVSCILEYPVFCNPCVLVSFIPVFCFLESYYPVLLFVVFPIILKYNWCIFQVFYNVYHRMLTTVSQYPVSQSFLYPIY